MREPLQNTDHTAVLQRRAQAMRQGRDAKLALDRLVRRVIREELDEQERLLVSLHWYQGKSVDELAALTGLERSKVYRRLDRIHQTIYDHLKYAVDYHIEPPYSEQAKQTLRDAGQNTFAIEALDCVGERIAQLRREKHLSLQDVYRGTGITPVRMEEIEADGRQMMMTELSLLTKLFCVDVTALLFGMDGKGTSH